jgi:hypothetical protein
MWLDTYGESRASFKPDRRAEEGKKFGAHARTLFPDGQLVDTLDLDEAARITRQLIDSGATAIFEAAFVTDDHAVRVDILRRNGAGWDIIEVKASNAIKAHHLNDVAMQKLICEAAGLNIMRVFVLHLNKQHRHPAVQALTICEEVTELLGEHLTRARSEMPKALGLLRSNSVPKRAIGSQCKDDCPHYGDCFAEVPKYSVFNIPRLANKKDDLIAQKILAVSELPPDYMLTPTQQLHVNAMSSVSAYIDRDSIRRSLKVLSFPIHFLDFEAFDPGMPMFDGTWPYQHIPFQFSCHILRADDTIEHKEFLHTDPGDPRPELLAALLHAVEPRGSIVVYSAQYERKILRELASAYPSYAAQCNDMISRLWDQAEIFKSDFIHPDFCGSYSIKAVLPVLVPSLGYDALAHVHNGTEAQDVWRSVINDRTSADRETKIKALLAYCRLDTLAMVELHRILRSL